VISKNTDPEIKISQPCNLADYCPGIRQKHKTMGNSYSGSGIRNTRDLVYFRFQG